VAYEIASRVILIQIYESSGGWECYLPVSESVQATPTLEAASCMLGMLDEGRELVRLMAGLRLLHPHAVLKGQIDALRGESYDGLGIDCRPVPMHVHQQLEKLGWVWDTEVDESDPAVIECWKFWYRR